MRGYEVIVRDMWMQGKSINLIVDINVKVMVKIRVGDRIEKHARSLNGIILEYAGSYDFYTLKSRVMTGKKILMGITRDFNYCTTQEEIKFCA